MTKDNYNLATCTCDGWLKQKQCKHVLGIALRQKYCEAPAAAKDIPIGEKRKRGRPSKAKKALIVQ
jgi:hypothetical protein